MPIVYFINEGIQLEAEAGETLQSAQIRAGLQPNAPCGGNGSCGKCAVQIRTAGEKAFRQVLACQTRIEGDTELRTLCTENGAQVLTDAAAADAEFDPQLSIARIHVPRCQRGEGSSDWDRLKQALDGAFGARRWRANLKVASALGELIRAHSGDLTAVICGETLIDVHGGDRRHAMIAFDVGTTSIAGYLIDAADGETLARAGMLNPQRQFGADVILRASHALSGGIDELSSLVRGALNEITLRLCAEAGIEPSDIYAACAVGNSCMHHLLLGISPASLVRVPYNPAISEAITLSAAEIELNIHAGAPVLVLPVIAGFVGADTVACLLAGHWEALSQLTLLIDIGTNGEIVLGDHARRIACSTAAGPAFEGAKISCGMRGAPGAIDRVWLEDGALKWHVIGDVPAQGICGSGLIDLVAALLETGEINESGRLSGGPKYRLGDSDVVLTQKDIREVQLAKAAICAGIQLMAQRLGVSLAEIAQVNIAGAFGSCLNPRSALRIGLLPMELADTPITAVGNAAGAGACMALRSRRAWARAAELARGTEFLELATLPSFQDTFVDALEFGEAGT